MASLHNSLRFFERLKSKVTSFPTRLMVFDRLKSKKVVFVASPDFSEAVETCILELLGVKRIDLTPQELIVLDNEVSFWYKKVPTWWKHPKIGRNKKTFVRVHRVFLSKTINLNTVSLHIHSKSLYSSPEMSYFHDFPSLLRS
jgi:hypothetical protein